MRRGRPKKVRTIKRSPQIRQFSPRGRVGRPGYIELNLEEFEAIRLSDQMALSQQESAKFMNISQQTFSRVLRNARRQLAEALVKGDIIRVNGGAYKLEK